MYRISRQLDLHDIVGSEIQQVCVGRYDVQFNFGSGRRICVQGDVEILSNSDIVAKWDEEHGWSSTAFFSLLNVPIEGFSIPHDRLLVITLTGCLSLNLHDSSDQYECMQIYPEGIVV